MAVAGCGCVGGWCAGAAGRYSGVMSLKVPEFTPQVPEIISRWGGRAAGRAGRQGDGGRLGSARTGSSRQSATDFRLGTPRIRSRRNCASQENTLLLSNGGMEFVALTTKYLLHMGSGQTCILSSQPNPPQRRRRRKRKEKKRQKCQEASVSPSNL